ncbi:MAG: hypothetical protein PV344_06985, partial [Anaplasma sp.]|nr:hypothetical protein [Anaplasma sp.]
MTSQPHDLARKFQTTHSAHEICDVTRGIKVITRWHLMRLTGRRMSEMISLYKVIYLPQKKNVLNLRRDSNPRPFGCPSYTLPTRPRTAHF